MSRTSRPETCRCEGKGKLKIATAEQDTGMAPETFLIEITRDGPFIVHGAPPLVQQIIVQDPGGQSWDYREGARFEVKEGTALCRCGESANKPYCDSTHSSGDFDGTERAGFEPVLQGAEVIEGPILHLADNEKYCCYVRFCDEADRVWNTVLQSDLDSVALVKRIVHRCAGGRLTAWDAKTGKKCEVVFEPSLGLIQDPAIDCSGPLWVRGGIRIKSADGQMYEIRNRVALCRCGYSSHKPHCDGSHASMKWKDGLPTHPHQP